MIVEIPEEKIEGIIRAIEAADSESLNTDEAIWLVCQLRPGHWLCRDRVDK